MTFVLRRVAQAVPLIAGVIALNFVLIHLAPGDPALMLAGEAGAATEEGLRAVRAEFGLDQSLGWQLTVYVRKLVVADLGFSYAYRESVLKLIVERLPTTMLLMGTALILAVGLGLSLGIIAACYPRSPLDTFITTFAMFGYATPVFWTGVLLLLAFAVYLPWFPTHGMATIGLMDGPWGKAVDVGHHLVLPAVTLGVIYIALYAKLVRTSMLEVFETDFVRTARAKGLGEACVVLKHVLHNALLPVVTVAGLQVGQVLAGTVLVETVFSWPGMGQLILDSILRRDYPLLLGTLFFSSIVVIAMNLVTDLCYGLLDPRIRYA